MSGDLILNVKECLMVCSGSQCSGSVVSRQVGYLNAKNDIERFLRKLKWLKSDKRLRRGF